MKLIIFSTRRLHLKSLDLLNKLYDKALKFASCSGSSKDQLKAFTGQHVVQNSQQRLLVFTVVCVQGLKKVMRNVVHSQNSTGGNVYII